MPLPRIGLVEQSGKHARMGTVRPLQVTRDDRAIVAGLIEDEAWAPLALFDRYARDVQRVLTRVLGVDAELDDLTHDVFIRALEGIRGLDDPDKLRSWLVSISVFTARERIRRRRRRWWMVLVPHDELPDPPASAIDECSQELVAATYRVLDQIETDDRVALALRLLEGLDVADVAQACRVSRSTAKRRIARAEQRFRQLAAAEPALQEWTEGGES